MKAGKLDRRVRIEVATKGDNGYNETQTWNELTTVPAQVIPSAGKEARAQLGRDERLTSSFRIRWSARSAWARRSSTAGMRAWRRAT